MDIDLDALAVIAEGFLYDTCTIRRDTPGVRDDTFDTATGEYVAPVGDIAVTYSGPCALAPQGQAHQGANPYGDPSLPSQERAYIGLLPRDAATDVRPGDLLTVDTSRFDTSLPATVWVVGDDAAVSTFAVVRTVALTRYRAP